MDIAEMMNDGLPEGMTMAEFIKTYEITMEVEGGVDPRHLRSIKPVKDDDGWEHFAWRVTFTRGRETLTTPYRTGTGHSKELPIQPWEGAPRLVPTPPRAEDVLDSLASDAGAYENARNFEDFASDFGYDTDSRKAEAIYRACGELAKELRFLLGREAYEQLLWGTERL